MFFNFCCFGRRCAVNNYYLSVFIKRCISRSYYDVLKVSPTCSSKEIRDAFIVLSKQNHPDKHMNDPSMHEKFVQINEAYSTLINPSKRRAYDLTLYHKRKLGAPYDSPYRTERKSSTYSETFHSNRDSAKNSSYKSADEGEHYKDPFSWQFYDQSQNKFQDESFGSKKFSNSTIVTLLISFTLVGVILQILAIRSSFLSNHEKMLEKSREYSLIHSMARERAKLYGNTHQIEVLKNNLEKSFQPINDQDEPKIESQPVERIAVPISDKGKNEGSRRCALHGNHDGKAVAVHRHDKNRKDSTDQSCSDLPVTNSLVKTCKKCKRCQKAINK